MSDAEEQWSDLREFADKTVDEVARSIEQALRGASLEPEWVSVANRSTFASEIVFGSRPWAQWPIAGGDRRRIYVSLHRGVSEGWIVHVDNVWLHVEGPADHWRTQPLIRIKTLTRSHGWAVTAFVSSLLDIA
ncbi:hypothetical protein [Burkholderia gladioli]|uniref:hypothetical protein n=1 Tax=Burkholderia gladioli TaxID=28095 RepID=UPI003D1FAF36